MTASVKPTPSDPKIRNLQGQIAADRQALEKAKGECVHTYEFGQGAITGLAMSDVDGWYNLGTNYSFTVYCSQCATSNHLYARRTCPLCGSEVKSDWFDCGELGLGSINVRYFGFDRSRYSVREYSCQNQRCDFKGVSMAPCCL